MSNKRFRYLKVEAVPVERAQLLLIESRKKLWE